MTDSFVGQKYLVGPKIGSGAFGEIFQGINVTTEERVAVKLEPKYNKFPQLMFEAHLYKYVLTSSYSIGVPKIHWVGSEGDHTIMVMELLGPSLEDLFQFCGRRLSLKTTLMIAEQLIDRIDYLHSREYLHRDIKPDNFVMGVGKKAHVLYVIDFGLAKRWRKRGEHLAYKEGKGLTGTARYCSVNTHLGLEQSRRDDMESIGHVLLYLVRGWLPWQGLRAVNRAAQYDRISEKKIATPIDALCRDLPEEFTKYMLYTRSLRFEAKPDYKYLRQLFRDVFVRHDFKLDYQYDWLQVRGGDAPKGERGPTSNRSGRSSNRSRDESTPGSKRVHGADQSQQFSEAQ